MDQQKIDVWEMVGAATVVVIVLALIVNGTIGWGEAGAAWTQAVGSIVGLAVAIWLPVRLRGIERHEREEQNLERATVGSVRTLGKLVSFRVYLSVLKDDVERLKATGRPLSRLKIITLFESLDLPTDQDVIELLPVGRSVASLVAKVVVDVAVIRGVLNMMKALDDPNLQSEIWARHEDLAKSTAKVVDHSIEVLRVLQGDSFWNESNKKPPAQP